MDVYVLNKISNKYWFLCLNDIISQTLSMKYSYLFYTDYIIASKYRMKKVKQDLNISVLYSLYN